MKSKSLAFQPKAAILMLFVLLAGCVPGPVDVLTPTAMATAVPLDVNLILNPNISEVMAGQTVALGVEVSGPGIEIKWSVVRGTLSAYEGAAVIYTPPNTAGIDTVTVEVTGAPGTTIKTVTFNVIVANTETPVPTDTRTPTAAPQPIICNHPAVTKKLFPQLENVNGQFPMYGPETEPNLVCEAVYDRVHTPGGMAVHIKYENVGRNFAWWGIAIKDPDSYDASQHSRLCFWVYAEQPNQAFRVKMKDKTRKEAGDVVTTELTGQWDEICTNISDFADAGIQVDRMDNINLGFEQPSGSAEIWIADFEFR